MQDEFGMESLLQELFEPLGATEFRRMFGGTGIFRHGLMFALVFDGRLCMKVDAENQPDFEGEGMQQWTYPGRTGSKNMGYWFVPERLLDDPEVFVEWAQRAFEAAARIDAAKPVSKRKLSGI